MIDKSDIVIESDPSICLMDNCDGTVSFELISTDALEEIARKMDKEECEYHNFYVDFILEESGEIGISNTLLIISDESAETSYEMDDNEAARVFEAITEQLPSVYPGEKSGKGIILKEF